MKKTLLVAMLCSSVALGRPPTAEERAYLRAEMARAEADAADGGYRICRPGESIGCSGRPCLSGVSFDGGSEDDCGNNINELPVDAPVVDEAPEPILFEADGVTAKAPTRATVKLKKGEKAPFPGRLADAQTQTYREQINTRNEVEALNLKTGTVVTDTPVFIAIISGTAVAGIIAGVVIGVKAAEALKKP